MDAALVAAADVVRMARTLSNATSPASAERGRRLLVMAEEAMDRLEADAEALEMDAQQAPAD